jgi:hypothetical protein
MIKERDGLELKQQNSAIHAYSKALGFPTLTKQASFGSIREARTSLLTSRGLNGALRRRHYTSHEAKLVAPAIFLIENKAI